MTRWASYSTEEKIVTMVEAVRRALVAIGEVSNDELAAYVKNEFGITIRPNFMPVIRAAVKDKENLEAWRRRAGEAAPAKSEEGPSAAA